ncbi:MAG TPA: BamA/TamA family outer membrane protein [Casimicrobiaceae bacterium]|nr:BamA/TamA family outer membrane protein [Casimicrobiaceae bacterium]
MCRSGGSKRHRWVLVAALVLLAVEIARASDPQAYTVALASTGNHALDDAMKASSQLESLQAAGPIAPFALVGRAQQDVERLQTVLQAFGYYDGKVTITVDDRPLDDPGLPDALDALPKDRSAAVAVSVELGPLYHLRKIALEGQMPEDAYARLGLVSGEPAVAAQVLDAQKRLLTALQEQGYALATVSAPVAYEDPAAQVLDVSYQVHAGPQVDIGEISVNGLHDVHESLVRERLLVHTGERYSPSRIEKARQDLLSLGVFAGVSVRAATELDAQGRIPITFDVQERLRRVVGLTAAFSTDLGASGKATWSHRNLFGNAEQLNLVAAIVGIGGSATTGLGYNLSAQYVKPEFLHRDQQLELSVGALKQQLEAYDQEAIVAGTSVRRKFSDEWSGSVGVSGIKERILQEGETRYYTLLSLPVNAKYDSTGLVNPLDDPLHGLRASVTVTPTQSFGDSSATFLILQGSASGYIDLGALGLGPPGGTVIAWRGLIGSAQGASLFSLPPDQRFYAGGSTTVRGFKYQSIAPQFPDQTPIGGTSIDAAAIELRQRLPANFGAAVFVDAGQVGATSTPFTGTLHVGVGAGVRYYTAIGPIRFDLAVPVNRQPGGDRYEIYIGLGQAF